MSVVNGKGKPRAGAAEEQAVLFTAEVEGPFAAVIFNGPVDAVLSYRIPPRLRQHVQPGQRLRVPLGRGNRPEVGYCVRIDERAEVEPGRVKDVLEILDNPPLIDAAMLELTRWMANYYACTWGQALDAVVPSGVKKQAGTRVGTFLTVPDEVRLSRDTLALPPKQAEALAILCRSESFLTVADLCRLARCGTGPIKALRDGGLVNTVRRRVDKDPLWLASLEGEGEKEPPRAPLTLTNDQAAVLEALTPALAANAFTAFLLHGVTGSGKTEVYLTAIERVVAQGKEAIVLVPEISLTPQTIRRFRRRFPSIAVLHSHLSDADRHRHWKSIAAGEVQVVVGARSAVFAPARRLGLIVIDEEHEGTFKQENAPRYHARDVAVKRAQMERVPVLLGSATPSLESWHNAELGRYTRLTLPARVAERAMPEVGLIDLRTEKPQPGHKGAALSATLRIAMADALADRGQVILLLNRRGFHTFILCPKCGHVLKCSACDVSLTYHQERARAICHTCDAELLPPRSCPSCNATQLHYGGVGTERLEREVRMAFPDATVRRMDSDTMRTPGSHERVLAEFRAGAVQILLGTQMIAKGLDFPHVTLVGVVSADTALHLPDFRAAERTFQLVAQVAGRTGRGDRPGRVLVQTYSPDNPAIQHAARHDYLGFVSSELPERQARGCPPFARLVRMVARGEDEARVRSFMEKLAEALRQVAGPEVRLLGPAPAPVVKIRNQYRYHIQLRASAPGRLQTLLHELLPGLALPDGVHLATDVDPISML